MSLHAPRVAPLIAIGWMCCAATACDVHGPAAGAADRTDAASASGGRTAGRDDAGRVGAGGRDAGAPPAPRDAGIARADAALAIDAAAAPVDASAIDDPDSHAFDTTTGALRVDYARYLSKHDVVFNRPNPDPIRGLTVGNGRTGAIVWSANGLTMQVSGVDTSPQTAFSAGLANLSTTPPIDADASGFQQRLALYDGVLTTRYAAGRTVTVLGQRDAELIGIHVEDARDDVTAIAFELGLWDVSALDNSGAVRDLDSWKTVGTYADADSAGLSRGQDDPDHFGYTLAATVEGAAFSAQAVGGSKVRFTIAPGARYTIWIACATRLNAPGNDSVARAKALLHDVRNQGYAKTRAAYEAFWHAFWARSFVQYESAGGDAGYLENVYYLATYMIAAGAYGTYPFHFINGVFRATADNTKWSNAYWYWNQRDVYHAFFASNHADVVQAFNRLYSRNAARLRADTMTRYGIDGIWVPETMGWNGNADGTVGSDYTKNIYSTGAEAAQNMIREYRYTGDEAYLRDTAYPFVRDVAKFYQHKLARDDATGAYFMASSNAHETYWNVKNAITDLAAVRSLFPLAIEASQRLGRDADLGTAWQELLDHLQAYPVDAEDYLPHDPPESQSHNGENVACELIWPYDLTGIDAPDYDRALSTWKHRPHPYDNVWANDAIQAARLGLGDDAYAGMVTMLRKYQSYPNGMTDNTNGVFEYLGVHLSVINEALMQSYDGRIRVFPALPADAAFVGRFTLAAQGGFLVSAERERGETKYVALRSVQGERATLVNPWRDRALQVRRVADDAIITSSSATEVAFDTARDAIYVIERVEKPLAAFADAHIEGEANQGEKRLPSSPCTLGLPAAP